MSEDAEFNDTIIQINRLLESEPNPATKILLSERDRMFFALKHEVDQLVLNIENNNPLFYGKWAAPIIQTKTITPALIEITDEYIQGNLLGPSTQFNWDDYFAHRALLSITMRNFSEAVAYFIKLSSSTDVFTVLTKWKTTQAILDKCLDNYSETNSFTPRFKSRRDPTAFWNLYKAIDKSRLSLAFIKAQTTTMHWQNMGSDIAYSDTITSIAHLCTIFETMLKDKCVLIDPSSNPGTIGTCVNTVLKNYRRPIYDGHESAKPSSDPSTIQDFILEYPNMIAAMNTSGTLDEYIGRCLCIARIMRNKCLHQLDYSNKLYTTFLEYRRYSDFLIESITVTQLI